MDDVIRAEVSDPSPVAAGVVAETPRPWGFWATLGLSMVVAVAFVFLQTVVVIVYMAVSTMCHSTGSGTPSPQNLGSDGLLLSLCSWFSLPFMLGLIALFIKLRRWWSLSDYLALHRFRAKTFIVWLGIIALFIAAFETFSGLIDRPTNEFMLQICQTAGFLPLLWATLLIEAPLFEEAFFRGFMFRGIAASRLGGLGAVVITSLIFTAMHLQYDAFALSYVLGLGVLLGVARWKTGSTCLTMALHAFANLISIVGVHWSIMFVGS